jgi:beta-lactam-binding protein with PASTA domain
LKAPAKTPVKLIRIPAVVGKSHQLAQDTMQAAGLYNLREEDATGQGRLLIWDRNWIVVRQSPPAGRRVRPETVITLSSKKIGE